MNSAAAKKAAINAAKLAREPLETLRSQAVPFLDEAKKELFGSFKSFSRQERSLAQEELKRARVEIELKDKQEEDDSASNQRAQEVSLMLEAYHHFDTKQNREEARIREEVIELQEEVAGLAKSTGFETKVHLQNPTNKVSKIDITFLTKLIKFLKIKVEESNSAKEIQLQRQNAKRTTGMLAWVSGKQMKVHEQGTLTLQG